MNPERAARMRDLPPPPPPTSGYAQPPPPPPPPPPAHAPPSAAGLDPAALARQKAMEIAARLAGKTGLGGGGGGSNLGKHARDDGDSGGGGRKRKKVYVPVAEHPDMNFLGLLIGPRGETQKNLEAQSGARILIRGRGSSKDGNDEDPHEELHVLIQADNDEQLQRAEDLVHDLLFNPERRNAVKQNQLRKVAEYNGSRDDDALKLSDALYSDDAIRSGQTAADFFGRRPNSGMNKDIQVPQERVGLVIGRGGETIKTLQSTSGAHIQVSKDSDTTGLRTISISGSEEEIARAEAEIQRLVSSGRESGGGGGGGGGGGSHYGPGAGGESVTISIPNDMVGLLIGKGGETIKMLQQKTGASIQVAKDSDMAPGARERPVTIAGAPSVVQAAQQEISALIQQNVQARASGLDPNAPVILRVPHAAVGIIIGRGGETIKTLQMRTGARIQISKDTTQAEREISLNGGPSQLDYAKSEIMNMVQEYMQRQGGGGGGYGSGGGYGAGGGYGSNQYYGGYDQNQQYGYYGGGYGQQPGGYDYSQYYQQQQQQGEPQPAGVQPAQAAGAAPAQQGEAGAAQSADAGGGQQGDGQQQYGGYPQGYDYAAYYQYYQQYYGQPPPEGGQGQGDQQGQQGHGQSQPPQQ